MHIAKRSIVIKPVFGKPFFEVELWSLLATHQIQVTKAPGALTTEFVDIFYVGWIDDLD